MTENIIKLANRTANALEKLTDKILSLEAELNNLRNATFEALDGIHKDLEPIINERHIRISKEREANESFRKMG